MRLASGLAVVGVALAVYGWSVLSAFGVVGASAQPSLSGGALAGAYAYQYQYGCPLNVRWHYSANGSKGGWSKTKSASCQTGFVSIGPQAMEGDLKLNPGTPIKTGYDFSLPGNKVGRTAIVTDAKVVFQLRCVSGAPAAPSTLTVVLATQTYAVNGSQWTPSGDQKSSLTYQGSGVIPDACGGGQVRLDKGGTFSGTFQLF